ncbi:MAG TPA: pilus assembly protein, partial [Citreicella sp.]|nr:pilus assembly protein [Citreicella sp.]
MSPAVTLILTFALVALCVGGLLFAMFQPQLVRSARARQRVGMVITHRPSSARPQEVDEGARRRRSVEETLREIEQKQKALSRSRARKSLQHRLREAGLDWTKRTYLGICLATA